MQSSILDHLTDAQREAVTHIDGPMLVVAGAGSGKTRVVTRRIAYLIEQGIRPHQILAMTFTNKAASEMKARVEELTGALPRWVGTFHSLCARFLRFDLDKLNEGRDGRFTIYDTTDQAGLVKDCLKQINLDDKRFKPKQVLSRISRAKCDFILPEDYGSGSWDDDAVARIYEAYEKRLREMNALDFDDLLVLTARMLADVPGLKEEYQARFHYVLIDEYQDTNRAQYLLMRLLAGGRENVHATGDPDQSIYSWRGADYRNIMDFQNDFPAARVVRLEQNYRSTKTILAAANELIRHNQDRIEKDLFTENDEGEPVTLASLPSDREEARWVLETVQDLARGGRSLAQMAIFYRTNAQSRVLEETCMSLGVPYQLIGGVRFYERKEIKDLLAHLKILVNPRDAVSLARIIGARATGVGAKTFERLREDAERQGQSAFALLCREDFTDAYSGRVSAKLKDFASWCRRLASIEQSPVGICVEAVLKASGLVGEIMRKVDVDINAEERMENLQQLLNRAVEFEEQNPDAALPQFLEDVALVEEVEAWQPGAELLTLMTLHSAKGLEFPVVFLVGLEEGLLPHQNSKTDAAVEEERRLFYVGLTRAMEQAYVSHAATRLQWGQLGVAAPSGFLSELPQDALEIIDMTGRFGDGLFDDESGEDDDDWGLDFDPDPWAEETPARQVSVGRSKPRANHDTFHLSDEDVLGEIVPAAASETIGPGAHVEHATFGRGKVLSVSRRQAVVQFFTGGVRMLHLDSAPLRKV